jgi:NAD(P)-dependent dehydrogenase (short-subunit alcohol dehydrogenase family)
VFDLFLSECTQLAILDLKKEDAEATAQDLVKAFKEQGRPDIHAIGLAVNIADEESVKSGFKHIKDTFGQVDVSCASRECDEAGLMGNAE